MADTRQYVQLKDCRLAGSGITLSDASITLSQMVFQNSGALTTMADFGLIGFATLEPETEREENISFTGITQNGNGTATLTGCVRGLRFVAPYTQDTTLRHSHAGGTVVRITNSSQFYDSLANKYNNETIHEGWTFNAFAENANPKIDSNSYVFTALDYITLGAASAVYLRLDGSNSPMTGPVNFGAYNITNLANAVNPQDAVTLSQLMSAIFAGALPATTIIPGLVLIATQSDWDNTIDTETIGSDTFYNIPPISMIKQGIIDIVNTVAFPAQQTFGADITNTSVSGDYGLNGGTSSTDGSAMYLLMDTNIPQIFKYVKDTNTGFYYRDSTNSAQGSPNDQEVWGVAEIGAFVYWAYVDTGTCQVDRFDVVGLANPNTMSFVGTVPNGADERKPCYTDGTDLYIHSSGGTYFRYTISGTVLTYVAGGDVGLNVNAQGFAFDGTNSIGRYSSVLRNFVPASGAVNSTVSVINNNPGLDPAALNSNANSYSGIALIDSTKVYLPVCYYQVDAGGDNQFSITLFPRTKPQ